MLDTAMLAQVSSSYAAAAVSTESKKLPFGGKDIIILGDLLQLPPISEYRAIKPLYWDMVSFALHQGSSRFDQDKRLTDGLVIFEMFKKFELTQQMRSKDKQHTRHIDALRTSTQQKHVCLHVPHVCKFPLMCLMYFKMPKFAYHRLIGLNVPKYKLALMCLNLL